MPLPQKKQWIEEKTIDFLKQNPEADDNTVASFMADRDKDYETVLNEMRGEPITMTPNKPTPISDAFVSANNGIRSAASTTGNAINSFIESFKTPAVAPEDMPPGQPTSPLPPFLNTTPAPAITDVPFVKNNVVPAVETATQLVKGVPTAAAELAEGAIGFTSNVGSNLSKLISGPSTGEPGADAVKNMLINGPAANVNLDTGMLKELPGIITENTRQYYTGQKNERPLIAEANFENIPQSKFTRQQVETFIGKNPQLSENAKEVLRAKAQPETFTESVEKTVADTPGAKGLIQDAKGLAEFMTVAPVEGFKTVRIALADAGLIDASASDEELKQEILNNPMGVFGRVAASALMGYGIAKKAVKATEKYRVNPKPQTEAEAMESKNVSDQNMQDTLKRSADYLYNRDTTKAGQTQAKEMKANVATPDAANYYPELKENGLTTRKEVMNFYGEKGETISQQEAAKRLRIAWPDVEELNYQNKLKANAQNGAQEASEIINDTNARPLPEAPVKTPEIKPAESAGTNNIPARPKRGLSSNLGIEAQNAYEAGVKKVKELWEMTKAEFDKENVLYHGGPEISDNILRRGAGGKRSDMGGLFFTDNKDYAKNYAKPAIYEVAKKDFADNVFDPRKPEHVEKLKDGFLKMVDEGEYENVADALKDYNKIKNLDLLDWSVGGQHIDIIKAAGFDGTIYRERPGNISKNTDGSFNVSGKPIYSVASFKKEVPASRNLHKDIVKKALDEGRPVPPEVLAEYPDLQPVSPESANNVRLGMFNLQDAYDAVVKRISGNPKNASLEKHLKTNLNPKLRANLKAAEGIEQPGILRKVLQSLSKIKNEATRHFADLDEAKYPELANDLRVYEDAGERAQAKAYYLTKDNIKNLDDVEYEAFRDNLVLLDIKRGVENGLYKTNDLPFGFDEKELDAHLKTVDPAEMRKNPELKEAADKIEAAITRRNEQMKAIKEEAVKNKLLPESVLNDDRYFHHQVLEFMNMKDSTAPGTTPKDVRVGGPKGYRKSRTGSLKDFNTEYAQSEWEVLSQMLKDNETAATLKKIKKLDITDNLKAEAKKQGLPATADVLQKLMPEGYTLWQPEKGNKFFKAFTIPEKIVNEILKKNDAVDIGMDDITKTKVIGTPKETWIVPEDVVKTLDGLRDPVKQPAFVSDIMHPLNTAWKVLQLMAPTRAANYMFTNFIGDSDALLAYAPKAFKKLPQAIIELYKNDRINNKTLEEAYAQSVIGTGQTAKEITDVNYADLVKGTKPSEYLNPIKLGAKYFEKVAAINNFRENALRYSVFKDFKERLDAGEKNIYGASDRAAIDALKNNTEKAAKLSRDLLGDYGNVSAMGEYIAQNWIPFYRWMEINTPRYYRMLKNARFEGGYEGALKGGVKTLKRFLQMNALGLTIQQLYHRALGAATGEDELQKARDVSKARNQPHAVVTPIFKFLFGGDIKDMVRTARAQGAFGDVTDMIFGTSDLFSDVMDVATNRMSFKEKADELGWKFETPADIFNIPAVRKYTMAAAPIARTVAEVSLGRAFGKNWGDSRPIRDNLQHIARSLTLGTAYDIATDTPKTESSVADLITYKTDIGEVAYNEVLRMKNKFLDEKGIGSMSMSNTPAGKAYYNLKRAYKLGDEKMIAKYEEQYNKEREKLGKKKVSSRELEKKIIDSADPQKFQNKKLLDEFEESLTKEQARKYYKAIDWYEKIYK